MARWRRRVGTPGRVIGDGRGRDRQGQRGPDGETDMEDPPKPVLRGEVQWVS